MEYARGICYPSKSVITRAISRLGESGYDLFENNCEHFAHWCKTGKTVSGQVNNANNMTRKVGGGLLGMAATGVCLPLVPLAIPGAIGIGAVVAAGCAVGHLVGELVTESVANSVDY